MNFESVQAFYQRLATDERFRNEILEDLRTDNELKTLTEKELQTIFGGDHPGMGPYDPDSDASRPIPVINPAYHGPLPIYGGPYPSDSITQYV